MAPKNRPINKNPVPIVAATTPTEETVTEIVETTETMEETTVSTETAAGSTTTTSSSDPEPEAESVTSARGETPGVVIYDELAYKAPETIDQILDMMDASNDKHTKFFAASLRKYIVTMGGNTPIDPKQGAIVQSNFINDFMTFCEGVEFGEFRYSWNLFLAIVRMSREQKFGCFKDMYVMRFLEHYRGSRERLGVYQNLMNVVLHTCDPNTRQSAVRGSMDFRKLMSAQGISEAINSKFTSFYSVQ